MNFSEGRQGRCSRTPSTPLNPPLMSSDRETQDLGLKITRLYYASTELLLKLHATLI